MVKEPKIQVRIFVRTKELKDALKAYASDIGSSIADLVADAWVKLLESKDYSIEFGQMYNESQFTGVDVLEGQSARGVSLMMEPEIAIKFDGVIDELQGQGIKGINRNVLTQEVIRRYIEPILIEKGYLEKTVFRDKGLAIKNIKNLRQTLGFKSARAFWLNYLHVDGKSVISYPQYSLMERRGEGNLDRIIGLIAERFNLDQDAFYYYDIEAFMDYIMGLGIVIPEDKNVEKE